MTNTTSKLFYETQLATRQADLEEAQRAVAQAVNDSVTAARALGSAQAEVNHQRNVDRQVDMIRRERDLHEARAKRVENYWWLAFVVGMAVGSAVSLWLAS